MAVQTSEELKNAFRAGKFATQADYENLIDTVFSQGGAPVIKVDNGDSERRQVIEDKLRDNSFYLSGDGDYFRPFPIEIFIEAYEDIVGSADRVVIVNIEWADHDKIPLYISTGYSVDEQAGVTAIGRFQAAEFIKIDGQWYPIGRAITTTQEALEEERNNYWSNH